MTADLELTALSDARDDRGFVAGFAVTDQTIVALGGQGEPVVVASSNARDFERRKSPGSHGLRDVLAVADQVWACGEHGTLGVTRDHGGKWAVIETGTDACLCALALGADGALWVVGDGGYAARIYGPKPARVDFATTTRLSAVFAVRDEIVALGDDGQLRRWRDGTVTTVACGTTKPLTWLAVTHKGTWIVAGDGGFLARSPDGQWYSRVASNTDADIEAVQALPDGRLVAVGDRGTVLVSADEGRTWKALEHALGELHLWSIERFGAGVVIGGDRGVIAKLAAPGDATWADRINVFEGLRNLDAVFAAGPGAFIANGLDTYLEAIDAAREEDDEDDDDADDDDADDDDDGDVSDDDEAADDDDDAGDDDEDDAAEADEDDEVSDEADEDDDDDDDDDEDDEDDEGDEDEGGEDDAEDLVGALAIFDEPGDAASFRECFGVALPPEAERWLAAMASRDKLDSFDEIYLDRDLWPAAGTHNLFELLVARVQENDTTDLVDAFAGTVCVGSLSDDDSYHLELYDDGGPRQVWYYETGEPTLTLFADSLDSLVYLGALGKAVELDKLSEEAHAAGLRALRGKVAPSYHFDVDADPEFVSLDSSAGRRDTEFFYRRARWLVALLAGAPLESVAAWFEPELNAVLPADQMQARYEACETLIPTALYATWRAFLFDEPELERYLEICRRHPARLVRDAAKLVDELRAGRPRLGTLDARAWLAGFRALDLDPRRAEQRELEAEARTRVATVRAQDLAAELEGTAPSSWHDVAWRWLGDGAAHRTLLARLDEQAGPAREQIVALDELRDLRARDRTIALPRLAAELSPVLEAVLVGSLVRGDDLHDVFKRPPPPPKPEAPGWDAIDRALSPIYASEHNGVEPQHYGTIVPYMVGGPDPIHGISAYPRSEPVPHWHFVTYGFTELFAKSTADPDTSGFGFELTFRLARTPADAAPPVWALNFLQNLGRYVFGSGNRFAAGHKMGLNGPIALEHSTKITAICFADDPELAEIDSEHGKARFLQIVGITDDEYKLIQEWSTTGLVDILKRRLPYLVTDLERRSILADATVAAEIEQRVAQEGSSEDLTFAGELGIDVDDGRVHITLGALYAATLPRAMRGRIRHGRPYELRGRNATLRLEPGASVGYRHENGALVLVITQELARELETELRGVLAGAYQFETWPALAVVITPSFIRSQGGEAIEVRGIADPAEARRMLENENARRAADAAEADASDDSEDDDDDDDDDDDEDDDVVVDRDEDDDVEDDDEDDEDDDDDDDDDDDWEESEIDEEPPDPARVAAALAMSDRAIKLAPDDSDIQFTHAMLLLDADRAALPGRLDELIRSLPELAAAVRIDVAVRMGKAPHLRFPEVVDIALAEPLPERILAGGQSGAVASFGDVASELFEALATAILEHLPGRMPALAQLLPDDVTLLANVAWKAVEAGQRDLAIRMYDRVLALPIPDDGDDRTNYLRALNNACVQAHAAKAYRAAVRIADRAQPVAHENPYIFHSAACAYAAVGDYLKAFQQIKLAVEHDYDHVAKLEIDNDLGPLLDWPEFKALFRDWHARQEGN